MVFDSSNTTHPSDISLSVSMATAGTVGAAGNLFLVILISSEYKNRKPHDWLFFILALGDFFLCVNQTLQAPFILRPQEAGCKITGAVAVTYIFDIISFQAPAFVAYNRYLSLYNNPLYQRVFTTRNVFIGWGIAMTISSLWITIFAVMGGLGKDSVGTCGVQITNSSVAVVMAACCTYVLSSYPILVYFTSKVVMKIRQHKKCASQSAIQSRLVSESQQIITAVMFSFGVPSIAQVPCVAIYMHQLFWPLLNPWVTRASVAAFLLAPAVNAYVTTYVMKEYRRKAIRIFRPAAVAPAPANPEPQVGETPM